MLGPKRVVPADDARRSRLVFLRPLDPRLLRRARAARVALVVDAVLGVLAALLVLAQAVLLARVAARSFEGATLADVATPTVLLVAVIVARALATWGFEAVGVRAATGVLSQLRLDLVTARLTGRPTASDGAESAAIATAAVDGVDALEGLFGRYLPQLVLAAIVPVAVLILVATLDPISAGLMILTLPLIPVFFWLIGRATANRARERWQAMSLLSTHFLDVVRGLPTLRAFNRGDAQVERIEQVSDEYRSATMGTLRLAFLSGTVLELAATLGVALVAVTVGVRLVDGGIAFEPALTVLLLAPELYLPLRNLAAGFHASADGAAVADRLLTLIEQPADAPGGTVIAPSPREAPITIESVSFAYPGRPQAALADVDLVLEPGECVALVGQSGGGKSTLASLLCLFAAPQSGRILIGDDDLADCDAAAWRRQIAWLPQSPTLFRGSVADNIRLADPIGDRRARARCRGGGGRRRVRQPPARRVRNARRRGRPAAVDGRGAAHRPRPRLPPRRSARRARRADGEPRPCERPRRGGCRRAVAPGTDDAAHRARRGAREPRRPDRHDRQWPDRGGSRMTATLNALVRLAGMPRKRVGLSIALGALTVLLGVGLIATSGYLISRAAEHPPVLSLGVTIVAVRFFGLSRPLARYFDRLVSHDLAFRSLGRLRARFYAAIEPLAPAQLEGFRQGDLVSRMVGDVDALQGLYLRGIGPPAVAIVVAVVVVVTAAVILPVAGLILGVGLLVAGVGVPLLAGALGRSTGARRRESRGELTADLVELLRGAPELVLYGAGAEAHRGRSAGRPRARAPCAARRSRGRARVRPARARRRSDDGGRPCTISVAAHSSGSLDRVLVATVTLLALASFECVTPLPAAAQELAATVAAGRRVLELIERPSRIADPEAPHPPPASPAVALENVTARYASGGPPVLDGFDLVLPPGGRIALIGESGAGKSTVVNLLFRFLDPEAGRVTIGGSDIRSLRQEDVRRTFALAGQEAHVFNSTIRENLLLAQPEATEDELIEVLRRARLDEWLATLPRGLDTLVGEEGSRLSGGQRQRLVLARALLVGAPVLVLDEPTAHLDPATAEQLMQDVFAAVDGQSILLITHRREGLDLVDRVIELENGRARENG